MPKIIGSQCIYCTGKQVAFLSLQIAFAQGHLWARTQDLKCYAGFWTSKCSQQHIVIRISRLWGCRVFWFCFCCSSGSCFCEADEAARWGLQSFCGACVSPWPLAFSGGLLPGETASGDPLPHRAARSKKTRRPPPVLAFLNAKQHGVGQYWLSVQPDSPGERASAPIPPTADHAGWKAWGTWPLRVNSNKSLFQLLHYPPASTRTGGGGCG